MWNQIAKALFSPLSLNRLPHLSFQPVFSLGSLPGKQEKHLNRWKMCLIVLGSTAPHCPAILQRYKTLQPHQLETTAWTTIMKWGVKYGSSGRGVALIMVRKGDFYKVFNVHTLIHHCTWKSYSVSWENHVQVCVVVSLGVLGGWRMKQSHREARCSRAPALQPFDVSITQMNPNNLPTSCTVLSLSKRSRN